MGKPWTVSGDMSLSSVLAGAGLYVQRRAESRPAARFSPLRTSGAYGMSKDSGIEIHQHDIGRKSTETDLA